MNKKRITIRSYHNDTRCWEAFPGSENSEIEMNVYTPGNQDQVWSIEDRKIKVNTKNKGEKVAECYQGKNRLETSNDAKDNQDQVFGFEEVKEKGDNIYRIYCKTENGGLLYVYGNSRTEKGIGLREKNLSDRELLWIIKDEK